MEHSFNVEVAKRYGLKAAIIIHDLQYWIAVNRANKCNFYEGRTWTYNSIRAWQVLYPYMSYKQIRTVFETLVKLGVLMKGEFNKSQYDRTSWYAFVDEQVWVDAFLNASYGPSGPVDLPKRAGQEAQDGQPIPAQTQTQTTAHKKSLEKKFSSPLDELEAHEGKKGQKVRKDMARPAAAQPGEPLGPEDMPEHDQASPQATTLKAAIEIYYNWFIGLTKFKPRLNGVEINALKSLLAYFRGLVKGDPGVEKGEIEARVLDVWRAILGQWGSLEPFIRKQIELRQINSNINTIINQLKHGPDVTGAKSPTGADISAESLYRKVMQYARAHGGTPTPG